MGEFLDSRFVKTQSLPGKIQNELLSDVTDFCTGLEYGLIASDPVTSIKVLQKRMYVPDEENNWNQQYNNFFFDIPLIF